MDHITAAGKNDIVVLMEMAMDLWKEETEDDLRKVLLDQMQSDKFCILLNRSGDEVLAFIYLGIRTDYVEGADKSPTGFIEGIYVKPDHRRKGLAKELVAEGERWLKDRGCIQVGSDIYIDNQTSYRFHTAIGFKEAGRLIAFIKNIDG